MFYIEYPIARQSSITIFLMHPVFRELQFEALITRTLITLSKDKCCKINYQIFTFIDYFFDKLQKSNDSPPSFWKEVKVRKENLES